MLGPILLLLLIAALFGAGFAIKALFWIALVMFAVWLIGFASHGPERRWYRW